MKSYMYIQVWYEYSVQYTQLSFWTMKFHQAQVSEDGTKYPWYSIGPMSSCHSNQRHADSTSAPLWRTFNTRNTCVPIALIWYTQVARSRDSHWHRYSTEMCGSSDTFFASATRSQLELKPMGCRVQYSTVQYILVIDNRTLKGYVVIYLENKSYQYKSKDNR